MKKHLFALTFLGLGTVLSAQQTSNLEQADFLAAVEQYNPVLLEKAAQDENYQNFLNKIASAYSMPRTEENQYALIALVKNFDNSLSLLQLHQEYTQGVLLQKMSGAELTALDEQMRSKLTDIMEDIYKQTIEVRNLQVKDYKNQLKAVKKDKSLSSAEKTAAAADLKKRIQNMKNAVKQLKRNHRQTIQSAAGVQLADFHAAADAAQQALLEQARVKQAAASDTEALSVKANHKKPVAK